MILKGAAPFEGRSRRQARRQICTIYVNGMFVQRRNQKFRRRAPLPHAKSSAPRFANWAEKSALM